MFYWTKTAITCIAAGLIGAYVGTYMTMDRVQREQKEISKLIEEYHPDKVHIIDINNDWHPDVIMEKGSKIVTYLGQSDGSLKLANMQELEQKVRQELAKIKK
jgi:hypothetical protein